MFGVRPRPPVAVAGYGKPIPVSDLEWRRRWPFVLTAILGVSIVIFAVVIYSLEVASLGYTTDKLTILGTTYGSTASTGAGIWCGFFIFLAGLLILIANLVLRTRLWATYAFIASIIAACFAIIIIGLDAKAVKDGNDLKNLFGTFIKKFQILAAQLAFACFVFLLLIFYIIIYIIVLIRTPRVRRPQIGAPPPFRY